MYKLNYKLPAPHITKTVLLVTAGVLVVLALVAYGAVRNVQEKHRQEVASALQKQQAEADKKAADAAYSKTQADLQVQSNKALAACTTLKQYAAAPATKKLVAVPPVCSIQ